MESRDRRQGDACARVEAQIRGRDISVSLTVVRTVGEVRPTVEKVGHRRIGEAERIAAVAVIARVAEPRLEARNGRRRPQELCSDLGRIKRILVRAQIGRASCRAECVSTCSSRWSTYHYKTKYIIYYKLQSI